jgi:nucleoside-diphosphate-sugar epimerase
VSLFFDNAKILVTGASGFLGQHCVNRLLGNCPSLHIAVRNKSDSVRSGIVEHCADLRVPAEAERLISQVRPTHLLHCAWATTPGSYRHAPENIDWLYAGVALVRAFGEHGGKRFVGVGSSAEYDPSDGPCSEDATLIRPASLYGQSKAALWAATIACAHRYGFSAAWGRVFLPYGPGDAPLRLIPSMLAALTASKPIEVTDGGQVRDFIFAPDAAELLVELLGAEASGAYNIATGRGVAVRDVIELIAARFNAHHLVRFGAVARRPDEYSSLVADMKKVERTFSWRPSMSVESGIDWVLKSAENHAIS